VFYERDLLVIWNSNDEFFDAARCGIDTEHLVNPGQLWLCFGSLSHMQHSSVGAAHAGGGAPLPLHRFAQAVPTVIDLPLCFELGANQLHTLIRQHRDEQMPISAILFMVKHRAQTQLTFEAAKHTLNIGQT